MTAVKKIPMRMCIACREMKPKNEMLRIVKSPEGVVALDFKGKAAGRGAYVCDSKACVDKCCKNKLLNKTFECGISSEVYERIKEDFVDRSK